MSHVTRLCAVALWVVLCGSPISAANRLRPIEPEGLVGHWRLQGDCKDYSGKGNHGTGQNVTFGEGADGSARGAAVLNGRDSWIEVPDAESLHLGAGDLSLSAWVKPEVPIRGIFGDIVSKFDARRRRGFNLHIAGSSSGYNSMCDARHVHFGIDDGYLGHWEDCGKPCESNSLVTCLVVFEGQLYCGIADAKDPHDAAHVFRWAGGTQWIDCGRLTAMASYQGRLFAGTGACRGRAEDVDPEGTLGRVYAVQVGQIVSHERDIGGDWTHLAVVRRGADLRLYVNGRLSASSTAPEGRVLDLSNSEPLLIGFGAQTYFSGAVADVRLYARALGAEEIVQLHANQTAQ